MDRGRVGEDRGSKEMDRCPLTAWSIHTRLGNPILSRRVQPSAELEHNCDGVGVAGEVDEDLKLVNIHLYILFALEIAVRFEPHSLGRM
jgi:hypothetical protein